MIKDGEAVVTKQENQMPILHLQLPIGTFSYFQLMNLKSEKLPF